MPVLDGYAAVRRIREIENERDLDRTPVVAMTAYAMQGDREKCLAADMDAYLSKPARPAEILATLQQLVPERGVGISTAIRDGVPPEVTQPAPLAEQYEQDASLPVFNRQELLERLGGREEMLGRFIDMFTKNVAGFMELLQAAAEKCDGEQIRIQAHTIKGAAANIAARRVRETAAEIEIHAREGRVEQAAGLVLKLTADLKAFHQEIMLQDAAN